MTKESVSKGKSYGGNPHIRYGTGKIKSKALPWHGVLLESFKRWFLVGSVACVSMTFGISEDALALGEPSTWTTVGTAFEMERLGIRQRYFICSNAVEVADGLSESDAASRILVASESWRLNADACRQGEETLVRVLPRIQSALNAFTLEWVSGGKKLRGRPWRSLEPWSLSRRERDLRIYSAKFINCWNLTLALLRSNKELLEACQGLPFERLVQRLRFPEPRYEREDGKKVFEQWASEQSGKRLTAQEKKTLFGWQFYVVEHERRPWMKLAQAIEARAEFAEGNSNPFYRGGDARRGGVGGEHASASHQLTPYVKEFADFEFGGNSAADCVEAWYGRAVAAGMKPAEEDEKLMARARAAKTPWTGSVGISVSHESYVKTIKIHGCVAQKELQAARDAVLCGLGIDERDGFALELDEPDKATLKSVFDVFPADRIQNFQLSGSGEFEMDVSGLAKCARMRSVTLRDCKVLGGVTLSRCADFCRFTARDCDLGGLDLLSGCSALTEVKMENCSFTSLKSLWAADRLSELSVPNTRNVVDLSVVRKLERLSSLDITGCQVKNFTALQGHPGLTTLKMEHLKGGVESLSCLINNSELETVRYSKEELPPTAYTEFARARRIKKHDGDLEGMLEEAVKDRDVQEIRRLCGLDITTDAALSALDFNNESDVAIFRMLVPKATKESLTGCLEKYLGSLGYGYSSRNSSYVPTNRAEIVELLLKSGAEPGEALSHMEHPAAKDMEMFRLMLPAASQKIKTELLQKNVKSFGDRGSWDRSVRQAADRLEVVRLLLESGADPNVRNFFGKTSLGNAVEYDGDLRLVKLLLEKGADATRCYAETEMFQNFYRGHGDDIWGTNRYALVELLLAHGLDVNAKGKSGRTPIGELVYSGGWGTEYDLKMAELLLKHGADPNAKQGVNLGSAIDIAYGKYNAKELTDLLAKYGGVVSEEAKQKKERQKRQREYHVDGHPARRQGFASGQSDRIREEMDRFHSELRKCTDAKERSKIFDEHSRRMREIRESSNRGEMRMQRSKEEPK